MANRVADGVRHGLGREFGDRVEAGFDLSGCEREEGVVVEARMGGRDRSRDAGMGEVGDPVSQFVIASGLRNATARGEGPVGEALELTGKEQRSLVESMEKLMALEAALREPLPGIGVTALEALAFVHRRLAVEPGRAPASAPDASGPPGGLFDPSGPAGGKRSAASAPVRRGGFRGSYQRHRVETHGQMSPGTPASPHPE